MALPEATNRGGQEPDASTLDACRRGDPRALERVLIGHGPALRRLLSRLAGPGEDVEDLLQTTYIAAIRSFPKFRGEASVRTWLSRIAVRTAQDRWRSPERRRRVLLEIVGSPIEPEETTAPADEQTDLQRKLARLYEHLNKIAPKKRMAFMLHIFEAHPIDEVAALMGASVSATKSRVFGARKELLSRTRKDPLLKELLATEDGP